ncbi:MAG: HDIG domain-containing metalloprotein [Phototrophicaceae bacterium]
MINRVQQFIETQYGIPEEQLTLYLQRFAVVIAALTFVLVASIIVAFDSVFLSLNNAASLNIGQIASRAIVAPPSGGSFVSEVLTERAREDARNSVPPTYSSSSIATVRTWDQRAEQTIAFIDDIRAAGRYDTQEQQLSDLEEMDYLIFDNPDNAVLALVLDDDTWDTVTDEVNNVIDFVYRDRIINAEAYIASQLNIQISPTFDDRTSALIFDIVDNFVKPNTFENIEATQAERDAAAAAVEPIQRTFVGGQIIIGANARIGAEEYEALAAFNLLAPEDSTFQQLARALIASTLTLVIFGLYIARFSPHLLYTQIKQMMIISITFLMMLALTRLLGVDGNIYLFPVAAMSLLFVAIADSHVAVITTLGLAFLIGLVASDSLEYTILIAAGGLIGILGLRQAERLNQFFVAGALISIVNIAVVLIFNPLTSSILNNEFITRLAFTIFGGLLLTPATALAAMFVVTLLFNLPTALKLIDLQQPNKPLLQRLLREAPGTYQHSLQVGNLAEQAANAIGADAQLTHVAALYHDIGKMHNPLYFTENQQDIGNPHDTLSDPYRSADIIIGHITEGDEMARQAGLPQRVRDFIREHHGTTQVFVFYQRALNAVNGDKAAVDISDFTYPGPKPQSKETAILMLADSCEAAVRSVKPQTKQEIRQLVSNIIDGKRKDGQLDESGLTLNDIKTILEIFVDILQGMFHPRINYQDAANAPAKSNPEPKPSAPTTTRTEMVTASENGAPSKAVDDQAKPENHKATQTINVVSDKQKTPTKTTPKVTSSQEVIVIADDEPLAEVPRLPSLDERRATMSLNATKPPAEPSDEASDTTETDQA